MSQNAFLIYGKRLLVKLCDLSSDPEQSFYYIIEDKKINRSSWTWPRQARLASILRV